MWIEIFVILAPFGNVLSEVTVGGIDRTMSAGVTSLGYKIIYGDEDMMAVNEVVNDAEKIQVLKSKVNVNEAIPPLPPQDVKCLMSSDNYCTKDMYKIKDNMIAITSFPMWAIFNENISCMYWLTAYNNDWHCVVMGVLVQAMKNDCVKCSLQEKESAGRIVASMMAHDPVAWKMFLTRYALLTKVKRSVPEPEEEISFNTVRFSEEITESIYRTLTPGANVRVKRYVMGKS